MPAHADAHGIAARAHRDARPHLEVFVDARGAAERDGAMALVDRAADADRHPLVAVDIGNHRQRGRGGDAGIRVARGVGDALLKIADALVRVRVGVRHRRAQLRDVDGVGGLGAGRDMGDLAFVAVSADGHRAFAFGDGARAEGDRIGGGCCRVRADGDRTGAGGNRA
ncbi:hypothetical protein X947_4287 [Burkholderia pseudomallei MSHR7334]|nr:hypothetical protein X947_4287 [Burkholderia pseudomallei MSHR7334]